MIWLEVGSSDQKRDILIDGYNRLFFQFVQLDRFIIFRYKSMFPLRLFVKYGFLQQVPHASGLD